MSGAEFLADTNIVIGYLGGQESARTRLEEIGATGKPLAVSQISRMELLSFPRLTAQEEETINSFLASVEVLLLDERIEAAAIELRRRKGLKLPDAIIGATALVNRLKLVTLDSKLADALS